MKFNKKKVFTLFALTLLITVLLLVNLNGSMSATEPSEPVKTVSLGTSGLGSSLGPIVLPDPTEIEIPFCQIGDIAICVENFTDLWAFQFKIWWLKDVVNYTGYEWKPYPSEWPSPITAGPVFGENTTHKSVAFSISALVGEPFSYSDRWRFIDLYWHCLEPGVDSPLIFDRDFTRLYDEFGIEIPIEEIIDGLIINPLTEPEDVELWPREVVDLEDPYIVGTQWHELHPVKSNYYQIMSWEPGMVLSPEDQIDMYVVDPPVKIYVYTDFVDPLSPICTEWFEESPTPQWWHLSSWEDNNGDGYLSPCDQIDMTNMDTGEVVWFHVQFIDPPGPEPGARMMHLDVKYWFQVDEVTVDMTLSPTEPGPQIFVEYKCGYWTFDPENPISTKWNEIDPVLGPVRCLHLTSWNDTGEPFGELSYSDTIDMTIMYPYPSAGSVEYYHVDFMSISLKLTPKPSPPVVPQPPTFGPVYLDSMISYDEFDLANPVCTKWHEIYPVNGTIWHLSSWEDTSFLSPSDQIVLQLKDPETHEPIPGTYAEYHVDKLTVAMNMSSLYEPGVWRIVKFEGSLKQFKNYHWTKPVSTQWHEVNPNYSRQWHLSSWEDTGEPFGELSPCDTIWMTDKETGLEEPFHVESLSTDMWLTKKPPPIPEDVELWPREVVDLEDPYIVGTQWHELHPVKSNYYQIMSWEPGEVLSPEDIVYMGETPFQVDDVTIDLEVYDESSDILYWLDYECGYWTFDPEDPICTKWNEIKNGSTHEPPFPPRCWHLTDWIDDGDGILDYCDYVIMTPNDPYPGTPTEFHVERVTVTLKLTEIEAPPLQHYVEFMGTLEEFQAMDYIHDPLGTAWVEIWPDQGEVSELWDWTDQPFLSPCDQIVLQLKDPEAHEPIPGTYAEYHVDKLTVAMNMSNPENVSDWHIVKFEGSLKQFKMYHWRYWDPYTFGPLFTQWHEVNPDYCTQWYLWEWADDGDDYLDYCDYILMVDKETGLGEWFHVESLSTDMWLTKKVHDVAVTAVTPYQTIVAGCAGVLRINVTVENQGYYTETFNVTAYANTTAIQTLTVTNLPPGNSTTITFTWNSTGFAKGNYTIRAVADTVPSETDTADNTLIDDTVQITIIGDVNGDWLVDMRDIGVACRAYGSYPGYPNWEPNADVTCDGTVDMRDIGIICAHYGEEDC